MRDISNRLALRIIMDWKIETKAQIAALMEERSLELFHRLKQCQEKPEKAKE